MDEFGRVVVNDEVRPAPVVPDDEEPFWSGWVENAKDTANEFGLGYDSVKARIGHDRSCIRRNSGLGYQEKSKIISRYCVHALCSLWSFLLR